MEKLRLEILGSKFYVLKTFRKKSCLLHCYRCSLHSNFKVVVAKRNCVCVCVFFFSDCEMLSLYKLKYKTPTVCEETTKGIQNYKKILKLKSRGQVKDVR